MKDNSKTIEHSYVGGDMCIGVIVEGEERGTAFIKERKNGKIRTREVSFDSLPNELKEIYNAYTIRPTV